MRSTVAYIHTDNLINNFNIIKKRCNNAKICAAVKADGYGHGAVEVSKILEKEGCDFFGVATIYEAEELKSQGIKKPIILFSLPVPTDIPELVKLKIEPIVTTLSYIELLENECKKENITLSIHLKVDTGMGRIGCKPLDSLNLCQRVISSNYLNLKGICTHLSTSELDNQEYTNMQLDIFREVIDNLNQNGIYPELLHASNSGGVINNSSSIFNMVRTGISLYGYPPAGDSVKLGFKPVLELRSKIVELKSVPKGSSISYGRTYITKDETIVATIPIGYADGYFRSLSNRGNVSINGNLYPIIGNICMDQLMVKVDKDIKLYDDVILIGISENQPNAATLAEQVGTISYEILTNIHRVKRIYYK